jgi:integrase
MAKIELRLSSKVQQETGRQEILIRFFNGSVFNLRTKSEIYVNADFFEYYVDRKKTHELLHNDIPDRINTATLQEAEKFGWALRESGELVVNGRRNETPEVIYHKEQLKRISSLKKHIIEKYEAADKDSVKGDWLSDIVDRYNHPEKYQVKVEKKEFYELVEQYITKRQLAESHARAFRVITRAIARYEGYIRATDDTRKNFVFDIDTVTRNDIEDFADYLKNEKELSDANPELFKKLFEDYPLAVGSGQHVLEGRGDNTVKNMLSRLKSLFRFYYERGDTNNRPFDGLKIGAAIFGTPYYITIEERNQIADADLDKAWKNYDEEKKKASKMPLKTLKVLRDIFVFQCFIGCRVGDLEKLTPQHIHNGVLVYTPHKTKDETEEPIQARVPLHSKALELIKKYKGQDRRGRLFPLISPQKYNEALKVIFTLAGVTRNVEIRNPKTGESEIRPINELAASHLARRTFIGNAYFKVADPNLIGKMSGHVDGSKAFKRYRKIEDETLKNVIDMIG